MPMDSVGHEFHVNKADLTSLCPTVSGTPSVKSATLGVESSVNLSVLNVINSHTWHVLTHIHGLGWKPLVSGTNQVLKFNFTTCTLVYFTTLIEMFYTNLHNFLRISD